MDMLERGRFGHAVSFKTRYATDIGVMLDHDQQTRNPLVSCSDETPGLF
jgi:hypothetical protein